MRTPNAVDFWRGVALVMIFIDHVPGNAFSRYTVGNFAISDAAELFVFFAGWALSYATGGPINPEPAPRVVLRLLSRAIEVYRGQLVITLIALALLATTAILRANPLYLEWHNAGAAFYDPVRATIGTVLLSYQLGYFNILPLYVALLLLAPMFVLLARWSKIAALLVSLGLYVLTLVTRIGPPSWPSPDPWFFNPFAWQLLMVLGFLAAELSRESDVFLQHIHRLVPVAVAVVAAGALLAVLEIGPDPLAVPEPRLFFVYDKGYLSPIRIVNVLAMIIAFKDVYRWISPHLGWTMTWMCAFGRNSLAIFCVSSVLALAGQIVRFVNQGLFLIDLAIVITGLVFMGFTAWFVEWRSRTPGLSQPRPS